MKDPSAYFRIERAQKAGGYETWRTSTEDVEKIFLQLFENTTVKNMIFDLVAQRLVAPKESAIKECRDFLTNHVVKDVMEG